MPEVIGETGVRTAWEGPGGKFLEQHHVLDLKRAQVCAFANEAIGTLGIYAFPFTTCPPSTFPKFHLKDK